MSDTTTFPTIFNQATDVPILMRERVMVALNRLAPDFTPDSGYLWAKLLAAEAELSRSLRVWFQPREVLPQSAQPAEIQAVATAGGIVEIEPGYDYTPALFLNDTWGLIELRQKPINALRTVIFAYPEPTQTLLAIPTDWFRLEAKYGRLNLVPVQSTITMPLNAYLLSVLGGGRTIPLMLQIRYNAGLTDTRNRWPDLVDLIFKVCALSIIDDAYLPQSGSSSIDGLSQSMSFDADKYREMLEKRTDKLRDVIHGPRFAVLM